MDCPRTKTRKIARLLLLALFPALIVWGVCQLTAYSSLPGRIGSVPTRLSSEYPDYERFSSPEQNESTLFIFFHPRCPCTKSTARNLAKLVARFERPVQILALAYEPEVAPADWMKTETVREFSMIPGCRIVPDVNAKASRYFGVYTSGHTLLFDASDNLVFSGGITPQRGHEGDCRSGNDLLRLVNADSIDIAPAPAEWPSFGCQIFLEEESL